MSVIGCCCACVYMLLFSPYRHVNVVHACMEKYHSINQEHQEVRSFSSHKVFYMFDNSCLQHVEINEFISVTYNASTSSVAVCYVLESHIILVV